jgi:hypothetical protein
MWDLRQRGLSTALDGAPEFAHKLDEIKKHAFSQAMRQLLPVTSQPQRAMSTSAEATLASAR